MAKNTEKTLSIPPLLISKDTDINLIFETDKAGGSLQFSVESFKELKEKEWKKLSPFGIASYIASREAYKRQGESKAPPLPPYSITPEGVSATQQLQVEGRDPNMHYAYVLPSQVNLRKRQGYVEANEDSDKDLDVFNRRGSTPIVGTVAKPELILMKVPKEHFEKNILGAWVRESRINNGQVAEVTAQSLEKQGVIANRGEEK